MTNVYRPEQLGYLVPPTKLDEANAIVYAYQKALKQVCEKHPDKYKYVPDSVVPFPCPEGLDCVSGRCEFTEQGCRAASTLDYYDCKRGKVPCDLASRKNCELCIYSTHRPSELEDEIEVHLPMLEGPDGDMCSAGDRKYYYFVDPKADKKMQEQKGYSRTRCKNKFDPDPYIFNGKKVPCKAHLDCAVDGVGGLCMLYGLPNEKGQTIRGHERKATGYCVDPGAGYLEYRHNFTQFPDEPPIPQCVSALSNVKQWCEMPWTRPAEPDDESDFVEQRVQRHPQTRAHPPFYYDDYTGRCHMTKEYCSAAIENGGYETSYGRSHEYLGGAFSTCTYPGGKKNEVREGYDCCTPLGQSIGQFFVGKNFYSELHDFVHGRMNLAEFYASNPATAYAFAGFLSDERLKTNVQLVVPDFAGPGIHGYLFAWSPLARQLYPEHTTATPLGWRPGLLASEVAAVYPSSVITDQHGFCFIRVDRDLYASNRAYQRVIHALQVFDDYTRRSTRINVEHVE